MQPKTINPQDLEQLRLIGAAAIEKQHGFGERFERRH